MNSDNLSIKSEELLVRKKKLNLALSILIAFLGVTSLWLKFFVIDGALAFRAFTVNGNLYTTIVMIIVAIINARALKSKQNSDSKLMYFITLSSAVTEAVIFIVVMIGYLPFLPDKPAVWPYHMFCLHVAIPILSVLRFIFFEKPVGVVKPLKLLTGAIPIGVYGLGVSIAIKLGVLPIVLVPYSFLDFDNNFIWYFLFALFLIPSFGYLWAWLFYRLNIRASVLWFDKEDVERMEKDRVKSAYDFDTVNSSILIVFVMSGLLLVASSLLLTSRTTTKVQHVDASYLAFFMLDDYDTKLGTEEWSARDGSLYKGDMKVGDGTEENANYSILPDEIVVYDTTFYMKASDLSPELAAKYDKDDYVSVVHSSGKKGPIQEVGETIDKSVIEGVNNSPDHDYYEIITIEKDINDPLYKSEYRKYFEEEKKERIKFYRYSLAFGSTMYDKGVGIVSICTPVSQITAQAKAAEANADIAMIVIVALIFIFLYMITMRWIKALEKSVVFLRELSYDRIPEEPLDLGKKKSMVGLAMRINKARNYKKEGRS